MEKKKKSGVAMINTCKNDARQHYVPGAKLTYVTSIKQTTISKYVREYYEREGEIIPLRGFIHDMGRTTTHKRWIIELYLNGYTEKEIQERTEHKILSIERYLRRYISCLLY